MKDKDGNNPEDVLAQLSNSRTSEAVLLSLYSKFHCINFSNVQRVRALKIISSTQCIRDASSTALRKAALEAGFAIIRSDLTSSIAITGAPYSFLEACRKILLDYVENVSSQDIVLVAKAVDILSQANVPTIIKLFHDREGMTFTKVIKLCLEKDSLQLHALSLLDLGLSVPESEQIGKAIMEDKIALIQLVYPLLFTLENNSVQAAALAAMKKLNLPVKPQPFWNKLKENTQKIYCKQMVEMVNQKQNWPVIWQFVVNMFGEELHTTGQLINHMLGVLERAFKHSDFEWTRVQAFECWNTLIDNFKSGLKNKKRIELIMIPLKANNHRIETLASAKLHTYIHLLRALGTDTLLFPDIVLNFITFCFGSEKSTIPPVRSYPALHEICVEALKELLLSPCMPELFVKAHKELMQAIGNCFLMENIPLVLLQDIWNRVLDLVRSNDGTETLKNLFYMVQKLVTQAGNGDTSGSFKFRSSLSPSIQTSSESQLNEHLGEKIVLIILNSMIQGEFALKHSLLRNRSLYIGSYNVMTGTPAFLFVEWLLTPALILGAGDSSVFKELISQMISVRLEESTGFMDYAQLVLKKLSLTDDTLSSNKKLFYECAADVWCVLANKLVEFIQDQGSINQGNAAEHDFRALYAVLLFPAQNLYFEFELIEKCSGSWRSLFYEAYEQAALVPTASSQELCDQVCARLAAVSKRNKSPKQLASIFCLLTCVLQVASDKFKSNKRCNKVQECVSSFLKELDSPTDQELVYCQSIACVRRCLLPNKASFKVVENVSCVISSLLKSKVNKFEPIDRLCLLLSDLKRVILFLLQRGGSKDSLSVLLQNILDIGKHHFSQKIRACIRELLDTLENKNANEIDSKSQDSTSMKLSVGNAFSPSNRPASSPKQALKKFAIQISPSSKSPGSVKKGPHNGASGSDVKFVRIETPPKKIILTQHQKEVRRERRQDIPALYQDLSQDTQSASQDASQDCVPLPSSPKIKSQVPLNEDAVMDIVDIDESIQVFRVKKSKLPNVVEKSNSLQECKKESCDFTPPAGFVLPPTGEGVLTEALPTENEVRLGKENEDTASPKPEKLIKNSRRGALTRSSSSESATTTRSGKVLKRSSLAPVESEPVLKRKPVRKSLPLTCSEEQPKTSLVETIVIESDTTDTESVSSSDASSTNSKLARKRGRRPKAIVQATVGIAAEADTKSTINQDSDLAATAKVLLKSKDGSESANKASSASDHSCSSPGKEMPVKKLIRGKILTRKRSNSNLDEFAVLNEKQKKGVEENQAFSAVDANESISRKVEDNSSPRSPRKNSPQSSSGVTFTLPPAKTLPRKMTRCSRTKNDSTKNISEANGNTGDINDSLEEVPLSILKQVQRDQGAAANCEDTSVSCLIPLSNENNRKNDSCSEDIINVLGMEHGTEESQEIIESSQEPLIHMVKPCAVSLEPFLDAEPNKEVEIDNVVVVKGPQAGSPYKIHPKADVDVTSVAHGSACPSLDNTCRTDSPSANIFLRVSETGTPLSGRDGTSNHPDINISKSASSPKSSIGGESFDGKGASDDTLKRTLCSEEEASEIVISHGKVGNGKDENPMLNGEVNPQPRNGCMPEWMHEKKNSPSSKPSKHFRTLSARSQVFMKSVKEIDNNSSPPKGNEMSPVSSPVQPKKTSKASVEPSINTTPTIKRSSRAEKLLGLGQAAAARGGETVLSNVPQSLCDKMNEEESEISHLNTNNLNSSHIVASSASLNVTNGTNSVLSSVHTTVMASPSLQRQGKVLEFDSLKYTPQKCLEDKGLREEWIRKTPCPEATPDSSILKRKREDDDVPSPSVKRKRVSFRDPPLSSFLKFNDSLDVPGTVFSADRSADKAHKIVEPIIVDQSVEDCSRPVRIDVEKTEDHGDAAVAKPNKLQGVISTKDNTKLSAGSPRGHKKRKSLNSHVGSIEERSDRTTVNSSSVIERNVEIEEDVCGHDKSVECSEQIDLQTQGSIEDLHHSSSLSPLYPALALCSHSVECLVSKLTSPVWKSALSRELTEKEIRTVGDLASLTEEKVDRLTVKPPKRANVCSILQDFEKQHDSLRDGVPCCLLKQNNECPEKCQDKLQDVLCNVTDEDILKTLTELGRKSQFSQTMLHSMHQQDIATVLARNQSVLRSVPIDSVAEVYISEVSKSTGHHEKNIKAHALLEILKWIPNKVILEALFSQMTSSDFIQDLDQKTSNDILETIALKVKKPSKHLKEVLLSKMSSFDIVEELDQKKSDDLLETLFCNVKKPSRHLRQVLLSKMSASDIEQELDEKKAEDLLNALAINIKNLPEHLSKLLLSKLPSSDIVENIEQKKAEDLLEALVSRMEKPSKQLREQLFSKMSSSDIVKGLGKNKSDDLLEALGCSMKTPSKHLRQVLFSKMNSSDVLEELDEKKSGDLLEALVCSMKTPSKHLRQVMFSKMNSSDVLEELDEKKSDDLLEALVCSMKTPSKHLRQVLFSKMNSSDVLEELDEKKSDDLLEALVRNVKKPTQSLMEVLIGKMSSSEVARQLDERKSEELLENLGSGANKFSKQFVETFISKISLSDIAQQLDKSKSEKLIETLLCNINEPSKEVKDVLLSKISPSDIANSDSIRSEETCKAILSQLPWKKTVSLLVEYGQNILKHDE